MLLTMDLDRPPVSSGLGYKLRTLALCTGPQRSLTTDDPPLLYCAWHVLLVCACPPLHCSPCQCTQPAQQAATH
jgi:hypothetical protein